MSNAFNNAQCPMSFDCINKQIPYCLIYRKLVEINFQLSTKAENQAPYLFKIATGNPWKPGTYSLVERTSNVLGRAQMSLFDTCGIASVLKDVE